MTNTDKAILAAAADALNLDSANILDHKITDDSVTIITTGFKKFKIARAELKIKQKKTEVKRKASVKK